MHDVTEFIVLMLPGGILGDLPCLCLGDFSRVRPNNWPSVVLCRAVLECVLG